MPVLYGLHLCSYKELKQLLSLFFALCKLREGGKNVLCAMPALAWTVTMRIFGTCTNREPPWVLLQPFTPGPLAPSPLAQLLQGTLRGCAARVTRVCPRPATPGAFPQAHWAAVAQAWGRASGQDPLFASSGVSQTDGLCFLVKRAYGSARDR